MFRWDICNGWVFDVLPGFVSDCNGMAVATVQQCNIHLSRNGSEWIFNWTFGSHTKAISLIDTFG